MARYLDWVRQICGSLPHTTERVRWEHNLLFCVGDKMYCVANLEPGNGPSQVTFKSTPEMFAELVEREGMIPAPYMARNYWVTVTNVDLFRQSELNQHIRASYLMVVAGLPKRSQARLGAAPNATSTAKPRSKPQPARKRKK